MGIIIYGNNQIPIGVDEFLIKCPCCETHSWADIMVISNYYHFYWMPIFPIEKEANIICKKCGLKRYGRAFDSTLISNYSEVKNNFRHPWVTYTGVGVLIIVLFTVLITAFMLHH